MLYFETGRKNLLSILSLPQGSLKSHSSHIKKRRRSVSRKQGQDQGHFRSSRREEIEEDKIHALVRIQLSNSKSQKLVFNSMNKIED